MISRSDLHEPRTDRLISRSALHEQISQFILITHNKRTMEIADTLYGVTMQEPGCSKLVSVKLTERPREASAA